MKITKLVAAVVVPLSYLSVANALVIDNFSVAGEQGSFADGVAFANNTPGAQQSGAGRLDFVSTFDASILGGQRDSYVLRTGGSNDVTLGGGQNSATINSPVLAHSQGPSSFGYSLTVWDAGNAGTDIAAEGLGGIDLAGLSSDGLQFEFGNSEVNSANQEQADIYVYLFTDANRWSSYKLELDSDSLSGSTLQVSFDEFSIGAGVVTLLDTVTVPELLPTAMASEAADIRDIGAVALLIDGTTKDGLDLELSLLDTDFIMAEVNVVPVPSAFLLMLAVLPLLRSRMRREV